MSKFVVQMAWADVPHISKEAKAALENSFSPHERAARTQGIPALGAGVIYPVHESEIVVEPFEIPKIWRHVYALDVGWNRTACLWGAHDSESDVLYLYSEHYRGEAEPAVHAQAIRARGTWIPGVIDPAAQGRSQSDGSTLLDIYRGLGLNLIEANNRVGGDLGGIYEVWQRLSSGRLKVFRTLENFLQEYRIYRRDDKGKIVKSNDHLMDCCLIGSTMVRTDCGDVALSDLVNTSGRVMSRNGAWAEYADARLTRRDAPVVTVCFSDGREVVCTPDHRFLTPEGWVKAEDMTGITCYDAISQRIQWSGFWHQKLSLLRSKFSMGAATASAAHIFAGMGVDCSIATCGLPTTVESQSLLGCTSTIWTKTRQTTTRVTSNFSASTITCPTISVGTPDHSPKTPWPRLQSGMVLMKGFSGIVSITKMLRRLCIGELSAFANNAEQLTKQRSRQVNSVQMHARRARVLRLASTTKNVFASSVALFLWRTTTMLSKRAHELAAVRCLDVSDAGKADVYCLNVPGTSAFAVNGGLVVHNCRYLVMSGIQTAAFRPMEQIRPMFRREAEKEWDPRDALREREGLTA